MTAEPTARLAVLIDGDNATPKIITALLGEIANFGTASVKRIGKGQVTMPGPVDPARLLVAELVKGAFDGVAGPITPDWPETK